MIDDENKPYFVVVWLSSYCLYTTRYNRAQTLNCLGTYRSRDPSDVDSLYFDFHNALTAVNLEEDEF